MDGEPCDAIVLSDLHLGNERKARPRVLSQFLGSLLDRQRWRPGRVVLGGDVFDDLDFRRWPTSHWAALAVLRQVEAAYPTTWVVGNHDGPDAAVRFLAGPGATVEPRRAVVATGGVLCGVVHGRTEYDLGAPSRHGDHCGVARDAVAAALAAQWRYASRDLREAVRVARGAMWYARHIGVQLIVCGHTHGPFCGPLGSVRYANSGSWTKGQVATYVVVRDGGLSLETFRPDDRGLHK